MKYLLAASVFFLVAVGRVAAFDPNVTEVSQPYTAVAVEKTENRPSDYLGELNGLPVLYEITSTKPFVLQAQVLQPQQAADKPVHFSLLAIRQPKQGGKVSEVARLDSAVFDWQSVKRSGLGMRFWQSPALSVPVEPGTYQIEISTPDNQGQYLLMLGATNASDGYATNLLSAYRTQQFFGLSFFHMLASAYVYFPLGSLLVLLIGYRLLVAKKRRTEPRI